MWDAIRAVQYMGPGERGGGGSENSAPRVLGYLAINAELQGSSLFLFEFILLLLSSTVTM